MDPSGTSNAQSANITKFLAAATSYGVPPEELFSKADLAEASSEHLGCVALTVLAIARITDTPPPRRFISKSPTRATTSGQPLYGAVGSSVSTPNLVGGRTTSPPAVKKRWTPPSPGLSTVRSASPVESGDAKRRGGEVETEDVFGPMDFDEVASSSPQRSGVRMSTTSRASVASSSQVTDGSNAYSSLLDPRSSTRFGTIRTMTTEATSLGTDAPSLTRTEGSSAAALLPLSDGDLLNAPSRTRSKRSSLPNGSPGGSQLDESPRRRDRKVSENAGVVDLSRVAEETDEGSLVQRPNARAPSSPTRDRSPAIRLGKGKWPDDFMNAFQYPARSSPVQVLENRDERPLVESPTSISPPIRRLPLDLASSEATEPISPLLPRRRSRNSTEPKDALAIGRESSPSSSRDSSTPSPGPGGPRPLRRQSTRAYTPRTSGEGRPGSDAPVPFPRSISGENPSASSFSPLSTLPSSSETLHGEAPTQTFVDSTRMPYQRARHRSEMDKARRSSFGDQPGPRLTGRSRFESMVNLGGGDGGSNDFPKAETSLTAGMDGSAVRKTLVVKEEGKPATHYVSPKRPLSAENRSLTVIQFVLSNSETVSGADSLAPCIVPST